MNLPTISSQVFVPRLLTIWYLVPFIPLVLWAVAKQWRYPSVLPPQWGTKSINDAIGSGATSALSASLIIALATTLIAVPLGAMIAWVLTHGRLAGKSIWMWVIFAPLAAPPSFIAIAGESLILQSRIPSLLVIPLILATTALPYTTFILRSALQAFDIRFEEDAAVLGASKKMILRKVRTPLLLLPLVAASLAAFLIGWTDYITTLVIGGGGITTLPLLVQSAAAGIGNDSVMATISLFSIIPPMFLLFVSYFGGRKFSAKGNE